MRGRAASRVTATSRPVVDRRIGGSAAADACSTAGMPHSGGHSLAASTATPRALGFAAERRQQAHARPCLQQLIPHEESPAASGASSCRMGLHSASARMHRPRWRSLPTACLWRFVKKDTCLPGVRAPGLHFSGTSEGSGGNCGRRPLAACVVRVPLRESGAVGRLHQRVTAKGAGGPRAIGEQSHAAGNAGYGSAAIRRAGSRGEGRRLRQPRAWLAAAALHAALAAGTTGGRGESDGGGSQGCRGKQHRQAHGKKMTHHAGLKFPLSHPCFDGSIAAARHTTPAIRLRE